MATWAEDVESTLKQLGGRASISDITNKVIKVRDVSKNKDPESTVRNTLYTNPKLFKDYGRGDWATIDHNTNNKK